MTRKAHAKQEENRLQLALLELKKSKDLCNQLIKERDDNEKEVIDILNKHKKLKAEMAAIHGQYLDVVNERDQLQTIVSSFDQDSDQVEVMVKRISDLEHQLNEAHLVISSIRNEDRDLKNLHTQKLYNDLVTCSSSHYSNIKGLSNNKLKKYIKISKFIRKTQSLIKKNNRLIKLNKNRSDLIEKLNLYKIKAYNTKIGYETDIQHLQAEINSLKHNLSYVTSKYELSRKEIQEHIKAIESLTSLSKYNQECFDSLTQNYLLCDCKNVSQKPDCDVTTQSIQPLCGVDSRTFQNYPENNVIMISDEIGRSMGSILSTSLGQPILNYCMPGCNFNDIIKKALCTKFSRDSTLILFCSRRDDVNRKYLIKMYDSLLLINVKKIITVTFPYKNNLQLYENNIRYSLNNCLHMIATNNSNKFHCLDINIYNRLLYIGNRFILSNYLKRQIANSLLYYINLAMPLARLGTAFIEESLSEINHCKSKSKLNYLN